MVCERRKIKIARLGEDRISFPAKIAETNARMRQGKDRFQMPGVLRSRDICAADETDDVVRLEFDAFCSVNAQEACKYYGNGSGNLACTR